MWVADFSNESSCGLQVVAKSAAGLELQRRFDSAFGRLLRNLRQRYLHPFNRLVRQRRRDIAGHDRLPDRQLAAQIEPPLKELPSLAPSLALARQQASLQARDGERQPRFLQPVADVL